MSQVINVDVPPDKLSLIRPCPDCAGSQRARQPAMDPICGTCRRWHGVVVEFFATADELRKFVATLT